VDVHDVVEAQQGLARAGYPGLRDPACGVGIPGGDQVGAQRAAAGRDPAVEQGAQFVRVETGAREGTRSCDLLPEQCLQLPVAGRTIDAGTKTRAFRRHRRVEALELRRCYDVHSRQFLP